MTVEVRGKTVKVTITTAAFVASVALANYMTATFGLVAIGPLLVTAGTFAAGFSLVARDGMHQTARKPVFAVPAAIVVAALVSAWTSTPELALASGLAFLASEMVDWAVFMPVRQRSLPAAIVVSSVVAAPVDTVLFLHIAGFPVTFTAALGQFIVKTLLAGAVALLLIRRDASAPSA